MSHIEDFTKVQIVNGSVNLVTLSYYDNSKVFKGIVRRTNDNSRNRQNAARRHDPAQFEGGRYSEIHFISDTHLEWTSLNYRKEKAAAISPSRRRMVLMMY